MGANAQTTVPTFTASQVLTADQMNQSARTGVPVFANTTARDAAFGGTGEKTLAEGQLCYLEDSNVVQYYDGAAWATVGPASAAGLVRVGGATFTAQTTVAFANDTFSSTYDNYKVILRLTGFPSSNSTVTMQVRDNSGAKTGANYNGVIFGNKATGGTEVLSTSGATAWSAGAASSSNGPLAYDFTIYGPQNSGFQTNWSGTMNGLVAGSGFSGVFGGWYAVNESHTGLSFAFSVAASGVYDVYGLSDS